jgi:hypothetical protein
MGDKEDVLQKIRAAFGANEYPGDAYLQGSNEGCEPAEEVEPFQGKTNWESIEAGFLDAHASAPSFFSEAGLRFFLPAYLVADVEGRLKTADPVILLTLGFSDMEVNVEMGNRKFVVRSGKLELINPLRYGAATFYDYARHRLSIFTREEAQAIVAYLEYRRDFSPHSPDKKQIAAALDGYWLERASKAPTAASLRQHLKEKSEMVAAIEATRKKQ